MGSDTQLKTKPQITMAEEKKSLINTCKNAFKWLKRGKGKGPKETKLERTVRSEEKAIIQPPKVTPVAVLLEKLENEKRKAQEENEEEDELKNFTYKIIDEEPRAHGIEYQSSVETVDSGFVDKGTDTEKELDDATDKETDDLTEKLKELSVDAEGKDEKKKKKTLKTVVITRAPVKSYNDAIHPKSHPYAVQKQDDNVFKQTQNLRQFQSQINKQTLSGGHVIVNDNKADNLFLAEAVNVVDQSVENFTNTTRDEQELFLTVANEYLGQEIQEWMEIYPSTNPIPLMGDDFDLADMAMTAFSPESTPIQVQQNPDYIGLSNYNAYETTLSQLNYVNDSLPHQRSLEKSFIFPTPPRSENMQSPMSDSFYQMSSSDYTLSPPSLSSLSSPIRNADLEAYQTLEEYVPEAEEETPKVEKKKPSNTLKYYKDLQKEISSKFSKRECCQINRHACKEIFQEHIQRLQKEERMNICLKVAKMESKHTFAVLRRLIVELSESGPNEDMQLSIFCLICEKMLAQKPEVFVDKFGLELIELAVLRCHSNPFVTRYLVQCSRVALKISGQGPGDTAHIFKELDSLGDNLLHACVRKGDECADVLSELVRKDADDVPLFNVHHNNSDGYTPLHLACSTHSAAEPRLRIAHVLLEHAGADLWRWDVKGGDSALHLAVNSATCDLHLIMVLFRNVERKEWKRLAHARNRSSVTSLDYARSASRSSSRPNYPPEVLEFLQKCR